MNGSSGFRGVPPPITCSAAGTSGSSSTPHNLSSEMNPLLRYHHPPYFPRLESLTSPLYNAAELAAATRLFPAAHLSALHAAAAAAAASNIPQTTAHHGMPPPSPLSQFHQAAVAAAAAAANQRSVGIAHPLLSPFLYPHLPTSAYGGQHQSPSSVPSTASIHQPFGTQQRGAYAEPPTLPGPNAPQLRYSLPLTTSQNVPPALARGTFASTAITNPTPDRSISDPMAAPATSIMTRARLPLSPVRTAFSRNISPAIAAVAASSASEMRPSTRSDHRQATPTAATATTSTSSDVKSSVAGAPKKQKNMNIDGLPTQPYYPSHFMKGTVIQLANGDLKRVEDLSTEDFIKSAHLSSKLKIDTSQVVRIEEKSGEIVLITFSVGGNKVQVSVEATVEQPFFVIGQGWSSFNPERTRNLYGLPCQRLQVGDVCISLTHRDATAKPATGEAASISNVGSPNLATGSRIPGATFISQAVRTSSAGELVRDDRGRRISSKRPAAVRSHCASDEGERIAKRTKYPSMEERSAISPPEISTRPRRPSKSGRWSI